MLKHLLLISLGAALGASSRYLLSRLLWNWPSFVSTFAVNIVGSLALGVWLGSRFGKTIESSSSSLSLQLFITVGFLGSFTTFSTFAKDIVNLASDSLFRSCILAMVQLVLGVFAFSLGAYTGRLLH